MKNTNIDSSQEKKFEAYAHGSWWFLGMCALVGLVMSGWAVFSHLYLVRDSGKQFCGSLLLPIIAFLGVGLGFRMVFAPRGFFQSERGGKLVSRIGLRGGIETRLTGLLLILISSGLIVLQLAMSLHHLGMIQMP